MMKKLILSTIVLTLCLFCTTTNANVTYHFNCITNNNPTDAAVGENQLFVTVSGAGSNKVLFTFSNTGPQTCSITDLYFDDDTNVLSAIFTIDNSDPGVSFSQLAWPPNLPGGITITPSFATNPGFSADSDPPTVFNGVNTGESLGIFFKLQTGSTFSNVINSLNNDTLRIGIHVQGFNIGGSESFVNSDMIPAPSTIALSSIGIILVGWLRTRKTL